jgi:toxin FitB
LVRYLIDTNVVSELRKPKPDRAAVSWLQGLELGQGFFSAVTFGEIRKGIELTRRQDSVKANDIEASAARKVLREF